MTTTYLQKQFTMLWNLFFGDENSHRDTVFNFLTMMYQAPGRYYHTLEHIQFGLEEIDNKQDILADNYGADLGLLRMAWWFHDIVYDVWRKDNEYRSAVLAKHILLANGIGGRCADGVGNMTRIMTIICATDYAKTFDSGITECCVIRDLDLLSLAAAPEQFDTNTKNIGKEFLRCIAPETYHKGRRAFLIGMWKKPHIYETELYRPHDETARLNLKRALKTMELEASVDKDKYTVDRRGHLHKKADGTTKETR